MSGRRLIDAIRLLHATRSVAKQHLLLRQRQLDVYSQTSSLARAVKSQTDRVTLTAKAAVALAKRMNEQGPTYDYSTAYPPPRQRESQAKAATDEPIPRKKSVPESHEAVAGSREGIKQDHHYEPAEENATADAPPEGELHVRQEEATTRPLPDGTIPPAGAKLKDTAAREGTFEHELSSTQARDTQREYEAQIPSVTATDPPRREANELTKGHDEDVYYKRSTEVNHDYSSLPRAKIPKHAETREGHDSKVDERGINADTFYTPGHDENKVAAQEKAEDVPEGVDVNVFRTARVSKMLGVGASQSTRQPPTTSQQSSPLPNLEPAQATGETSKAAMESFAADLARDAESPAHAGTGVSTSDATAPYQMRESRVPSSRLGRLWEYSGLGVSMAFGAVGESLRRVTGSSAGGSLMLSPGNMERLVAKLSRMRGAALKLGQMISFQDLKMLPGPIQDVLQRVQDSADYMPASQRDKVLAANLGADWRDLFSSFDEVPIAAASIGQVHKAVLESTGQDVAVKVQYPGVASSIDSDLSNLSILLTASRLLPKGLYLDKTIANARTELAWECDYLREASCARRFRTLLADETDIFTVPAIIDEASGKQVLTAELMHGVAVTKMKGLTQQDRDWVGTQLLRLALREITEFRFMQTDPNWTNFLYNKDTQKIELLDFGASRDFPAEFVEPYIGILRAASTGDRETIRTLSIELGYLMGSESKTMLNAHIDSVLTLAEPFRSNSPEVYDFRDQTITDRVRGLIPVMVRERLAPPPEETYSLHRKLSGAFLLCARLGSRVPCRQLFEDAMEKFEARK
jgi:aarF domain-containing kinase